MFFRLLLFRLKLFWNQKLFLVTAVVGGVSHFVFYNLRLASSVGSQKIFWDFSLAGSFIIQVLLACFFASQLFETEKLQKTLHLTLSMGVSRVNWLLSQFAGLWLGLLMADFLWSAISVLFAFLGGSNDGVWLMFFQIKISQFLEVGMILSMTLFFAFWVRPILAFFFSLSIVFVLHSVDQLQLILKDPTIVAYVDVWIIDLMMTSLRFLPPLDWFDLKPLLGYELSFPIEKMGILTLVAVLWSGFFSSAAYLSFRGRDL